MIALSYIAWLWAGLVAFMLVVIAWSDRRRARLEHRRSTFHDSYTTDARTYEARSA